VRTATISSRAVLGGGAYVYLRRWPVGLMDKASASGAGDSRFESWAGHVMRVDPYMRRTPLPDLAPLFHLFPPHCLYRHRCRESPSETNGVDAGKADSTLRSSQAVPHPSTNRALRRLTSEVRRDPVHSSRYGRQRFSSAWMGPPASVLRLTPPSAPYARPCTLPAGTGRHRGCAFWKARVSRAGART
jgi:hypothetical protein